MEISVQQLRNLVPIGSLDIERIKILMRYANVMTHRRGTRLFSIGDYDSAVLFLIEGEIALSTADKHTLKVSAGTEAARYPLAQLKPRSYDGEVQSAHATVLQVDGDMLDRLLTLAPGQEMYVHELGERDEQDGDEQWMMAVLQSPTFRRLPPANIQQLFDRMESLPVFADEIIVLQGEVGDYFYLIRKGTASVTRSNDDKLLRLATLNPPQSFGEEALLSDEPRNATVTMDTDGLLMRLDKRDFQELLRAPLLRSVSLGEASRMVQEGAVRVDVRSEAEFAHSSLGSALNLPLYLLRLRLPRLDKTRRYILFCDTGARSAAAGFLMSSAGFDVAILEGGLAAANHE